MLSYDLGWRSQLAASRRDALHWLHRCLASRVGGMIDIRGGRLWQCVAKADRAVRR
jgi:hypothetical protein